MRLRLPVDTVIHFGTKVLEGHFANDRLEQKFNENSEQSQTKITGFHESSKLSQERYHEITRACVKVFVICGIPCHVIESPFFIELLKTLRPGCMPLSRDNNLSGELFTQEAAVVNQQIIKELKNSTTLTLSCDRWTNVANESICLIHMPDHKEYLWCLKNLSEESHTSVFLQKK
ncbi:ribonuclease H-like domain-containing protein [Rhizophagus clarus]|uniref:Ribonuclease H-like domain-containing protein n=1 Tax=Rhizophagus clarus TaxID=94130 RepID=A0A8H3QMI8_9GLOM|nr:ribonuclease H-like domain-containing protein [Rhizophagus clarus]